MSNRKDDLAAYYSIVQSGVYAVLTRGVSAEVAARPPHRPLPLDSYWSDAIQWAFLAWYNPRNGYRDGFQDPPIPDAIRQIARIAKNHEDNGRRKIRRRLEILQQNQDVLAELYHGLRGEDLFEVVCSLKRDPQFFTLLASRLDPPTRRLLFSVLRDGKPTLEEAKTLGFATPADLRNAYRRIQYQAKQLLHVLAEPDEDC